MHSIVLPRVINLEVRMIETHSSNAHIFDETELDDFLFPILHINCLEVVAPVLGMRKKLNKLKINNFS